MMDVIGFGGRDDRWGIPIIGDRVFFGPGVIATGKIRIGNNVAVGANAVVDQDLPDNCTAVGIPARVVNDRGSDQLIELRKS
jgi:serine O-acetyltransferase